MGLVQPDYRVCGRSDTAVLPSITRMDICIYTDGLYTKGTRAQGTDPRVALGAERELP